MSQTLVAAREAESQRVLATAAPAGIGMDDVAEGVTVDGDEPEEDEETEASDEEVAAAQASPRNAMPASPDLDGEPGGMGRMGEDALDADVLEEEPPVEEEEVDEGYVLEDEDAELEEEEEEDEGLGPLGGGDEDY
jgi:hypothetical protein